MKTFFFHSMNNGILYGPWIPVYGFGVVIILFIFSIISKTKQSTFWKCFSAFFLIIITVTVLEEVGGILIEAVFHKKFWNYKNLPLHLGPYISLEMSFLWGILSLLYQRYVRPGLDLFIKKIPKFITIGILILQIVDAIFTWLI